MGAYEVGDVVDEAALSEFSRLLKEAFDNGAKRGGSMDWNDVDAAVEKAVEALGPVAAKFREDAEEGFDGEPELTVPNSAPSVVRAAAELLYAYRNNDGTDWEDIEKAWETLNSAEPEAGASPAPR